MTAFVLPALSVTSDLRGAVMEGAAVVAVERRRERLDDDRLLPGASGEMVVLAQWQRFLDHPRRQGVRLGREGGKHLRVLASAPLKIN